jgi:hypothetical protein
MEGVNLFKYSLHIYRIITVKSSVLLMDSNKNKSNMAIAKENDHRGEFDQNT